MKKERYRSRMEIIVDVLRAVSEESQDQKLTHIQSKANIPYTRLVSLLAELERIQLLSKKELNDRKVYQLTEKGVSYLKEYEKFRKLSQAFGLDI